MAATSPNDFSYENILTRAASYNKQLQIDKLSRLPFLDNATGIAQRPCHLQRRNKERFPSPLTYKIFAYYPHKWKKTKKNIISHSSVVRSADNYCNNVRAADLFSGGGLSAQDALWRELDDEDSRSTWATNPVYDMDSEVSELADETYGGRRKKRRTRAARSLKPNINIGFAPSSGRRRAVTNLYYSNNTNGSSVYDEDSNDKFPTPHFICEACGTRYKTKTGLNYHCNTQHANNSQPKKSNQISTVKNSQALSRSYGNAGLLSALIENALGDRDCSGTYNSKSRNLPSTIIEMRNFPNHTEAADSKEAWSCDYCGGDVRSNPKRPGGPGPEGLLCCSDCTRCAHFSCLQFMPNMITSVSGYRWQCLECKTCWLCGTSENDEEMLFCDDCDRGYHMFCLSPPLSQPPEGAWSCELCLQRFNEEAASIINSNANVSSEKSKPPS